MPAWLVKLLETDGAMTTVNRLGTDGKSRKTEVCMNHAANIIPVLEQLLHQDKTTQYAYLCDPAVRHVSKLKKEGRLIISLVCSSVLISMYRWLLWVSQYSDDEFIYRRSWITRPRVLG